MEDAGITIADLIGYFASAVVLISFIVKDVRKIRIVNSFGCALFVAYGILLGWNWPIIITNVAIIIVNAYYLFFAKSKSE
ncbi:MAG: uroporphyrinogen decarboxylase [Crocinitomicaceae bacterium]